MSKNNWNKIAKTYDIRNSTTGDKCRRNILFPTIDKLLEGYPIGSALDIGCGTGLLASRIESRGYQVKALDFSEEMIKIAKTKNDRVDFYVHDLDNSIPEESFSMDVVTSLMVFNSVNEKTYLNSINESFRILKEKGALLIALPHPLYISEYKNIIGFNKSKYMTHQVASYIWQNGEPVETDFYLRPLSYYINSIREAGFNLIKLLEPIPDDITSNEFTDDFSRIKEFPGFLIIECVK